MMNDYGIKKIMIIFICVLSIGYAQMVEANVIKVKTKEIDGAYRFSVTLKSTETGCEQYADWWEVVSKKGELLYRRILVHSHPDTQPFTRSGGSLNIDKDDIVYVRAHMNKEGYVGEVMHGSIAKGFKKSMEIPNFSKDIVTQAPLPEGCLY